MGLNMNKRFTGYLLLLFLLLTAVACGPVADGGTQPTAVVQEAPQDAEAGQPTSTAVSVPAEESYPAAESGYPPPVPMPEPREEGYPVVPQVPPTLTPLPDVYPPPAEAFLEPRFAFDLPLKAGATSVSGQAPPNLSIALVDVTFNGTLLGSGVTTPEGTFNFNVQELPEGHRVGLTFGELEPGSTIADMSVKYFPYRGDGFMNIPNVGIMLETVLVEP